MPIYGAYEVFFDRRKCTDCGVCVKFCPNTVIEVDKENRVFAKRERACVGCRICEDKCPHDAIFIRSTQPESLTRGMWTTDVIEDIRSKADTGRYLIRGYGTNGPLPHFDGLTIVPAQLAPPVPLDKYREECDISVTIGEGRASRPLRLRIPIMIAAMSYGAVSKETKTACALAANLCGTATNTGEGGTFPGEYESTKPNGYLVAQWASGRWGVSLDYLQNSDAVEIKTGQGAKPGMGGHLLADKVTEDISRVRGIPVGTDALSPCRFYDTLGLEDLKKIVDLLRDVTNYEKPIMLKLGPGRIYDDVRMAALAGVDAVAVDGAQGGTGAAPDIVTQNAGIPTIGTIGPAVRALKDLGLYRKVKLISLGGYRNGADVVKGLALGADIIGIASAAMIAMGCRVCEQCAKGMCPYGITSQDPELRKRLQPERAAQRLKNYLNVVVEEMKMLTMLSGHRSITELGREDLRALSFDAAAICGVKLIGLEDYVIPQRKRA